MMLAHSWATAERFILSREFFGMKLGLENITGFLADIGFPHNDYLSVHIAGTNGKGSTAVLLESVLRASGYKTGLYTSPHLIDLRERVRVNGRKISGRSVASFVDHHRQQLTSRKLSFFELTTALALDYFRRCRIDIAIIETGLGGRLDATNVLYPQLTITTDISRDHMEILGFSLARIAREKAGIIKESVPHLIGALPPAALDVIREVCRRREAPLHQLQPSEYRINIERSSLNFSYNGLACTNVTPALYGTHQLKNSLLVLKAASLLMEGGLAMSSKSIVHGLTSAHWPGRFQIVRKRGHPTLLFDVGHNASSIAAFVNSFKQKFPGRKAFFLSGFVKRKEHQKIISSLATVADRFALTPLRTRRSTDLDRLINELNWSGCPVEKFGSLAAAYNHLLKYASDDDIIAVVGSHFLVGEFFERYRIK